MTEKFSNLDPTTNSLSQYFSVFFPLVRWVIFNMTSHYPKQKEIAALIFSIKMNLLLVNVTILCNISWKAEKHAWPWKIEVARSTEAKLPLLYNLQNFEQPASMWLCFMTTVCVTTHPLRNTALIQPSNHNDGQCNNWLISVLVI